MNPWHSMFISLLAYVVIAIASYIMGRMDENRKWASIWFEQWKKIIDLDIRIAKHEHNRNSATIIETCNSGRELR